MNWLFGPDGRAALRSLASAKALVAFDFDGTLAPIVGQRSSAALRPGTLALLQQVAGRYPTAVLTGRAKADMLGRLPGVALRAVIGNHGAERARVGPSARRWRELARRWTHELGVLARTLPGVEIEDKGLSVTAHFRLAADPGLARRRLERAVQALRGARIVGGKEVLNVVPADAPHKGHALAALARRLGTNQVLFLGDDETDEDAFGHPLGIPAITVRVGRRSTSRATFYLRDQAEVDRLLEELAWLRPSPAKPARDEGRLQAALRFLRVLWALDHALNARSKRMLAEIGVSGPQRLVVRELGRKPGVSPGDLARVLHLHPASVTRLVAGLERRKLVAREADPTDTRRLRLRLTSRGQRVDASSSRTVEEAVLAVLSHAPARRIAESLTLLQDLAATLLPTGAAGPASRRV